MFKRMDHPIMDKAQQRRNPGRLGIWMNFRLWIVKIYRPESSCDADTGKNPISGSKITGGGD
jgi:hypothetical protein